MRLRVLGSSGAELGEYNLPAFLLDRCLLLDAGTIGPVLTEAEQRKIRYILISHAHLDHVKGIPFFADNLLMRNKRHSVTLVSISQVLKALKDNLLNNILWPDFTRIPDRNNPILKFKRVVPDRSFTVYGYNISVYSVNHSVPAVGYIIEDKKGKRLLYTGDTGPTDSLWGAKNRIDCAVVEVSFPNGMQNVALKTGHLTPRLLLQELTKMKNLPRKILVTHPKPQYLRQIQREIEALKIMNIKIAKDGETYAI